MFFREKCANDGISSILFVYIAHCMSVFVSYMYMRHYFVSSSLLRWNPLVGSSSFINILVVIFSVCMVWWRHYVGTWSDLLMCMWPLLLNSSFSEFQTSYCFYLDQETAFTYILKQMLVLLPCRITKWRRFFSPLLIRGPYTCIYCFSSVCLKQIVSYTFFLSYWIQVINLVYWVF